MSRHRAAFRVIPPGARLRLVHLGRLDPAKGTHILLEALGECPAAALDLDIYGIEQGADGRAVRDELQRFSRDDHRVRFLPPLAHEDVVRTMAEYDALVVPSQGMETGPLVVLEAWAAGIPVIGSHLGGIAALVQPGRDGVLVQPFDAPRVWARVIADSARNPGTLRRLRATIRPPRKMAAVAADMLSLYREVAGNRVAYQ